MKNILILGGAGFIGKNLTKSILKDNCNVRILDILAPQIHGNVPNEMDWLNNPRIDFVRGSICDKKILKNSLLGISHVVHLASETGTGQSMYEVERYNEINSQGTALLMDLIINDKDLDVKRIVLASSRSVYGEGAYECNECHTPSGRLFPNVRTLSQLEDHSWEPICNNCKKDLISIPTRENDPIKPASIYAATKFAQEELVRIGCNATGTDYAILRLQNVYGEGQSLQNPYTGILSIFSTRIRQGLDLPIFEDGQETRDFIHVEDVVKSISACLYSAEKLETIINVGSGIGTSVLKIASMLVEIFAKPINLNVTAEYRIGDIRHNIADISKLNNILSCNPTVDLATGLERFVSWVKTEPLPDDKSEIANAELLARNLMK
ncbi:NAD-dependent epimerase/dehydratase family protein [Amylibacter sp.]|nr:NAD-dependent epimerase/dehydratase family protein [Amylibacter sp.]MDC1532078.1 NAD-dependent epimerase/dehydratase family protein [Amylibacter sp.]